MKMPEAVFTNCREIGFGLGCKGLILHPSMPMGNLSLASGATGAGPEQLPKDKTKARMINLVVFKGGLQPKDASLQ